MVAAGALALVTAIIAYVPPFDEGARFSNPGVSLLLTGMGATATYISWRNRCRGPVGTFAALIDSAFYSAALTFAAVNTSDTYSIGLATVHGLMVLAFQAQMYSLNLLFALVMLLPVLVGVLGFDSNSTAKVILTSTYILMLILSYTTGTRRELLRKQKKLAQAVGAASRMADDSVQAALATTLLSLGHFLHELRNLQTAIRSNLSYIDMSAELDEDSREALQEVLEAQMAEEQLVTDTIDTLRQRASPANASFSLTKVIEAAAEDSHVEVNRELEGDFIINGVASQLAGVLTNLTRNAAQAGATRIGIDTRMEPSGQAVELVVHDNGPGIPADKRSMLFQPFVTSGNPIGTGLGLYLCRRYVELFGGTIEIGDGPLGGAAFVIRLPGRKVETARPALSEAHG